MFGRVSKAGPRYFVGIDKIITSQLELEPLPPHKVSAGPKFLRGPIFWKTWAIVKSGYNGYILGASRQKTHAKTLGI